MAAAQPFDTYAAWQTAVGEVIASAEHEVLIYDSDLSACGLETAVGVAALGALLQRSSAALAVRVLLGSADHLERHCPRLLRLIGQYTPRIRVRVLREDGPDAAQHCLALADGQHLAIRFHRDGARGKHVSGDPVGSAALLAQFETMWISAGDGPNGLPLGI